MAGFADDASASGAGVACPMFRRNGTGVDGHDERLGLVDGIEQGFHPDDMRRETAVEADHEDRCRLAARADRPDRLLDCDDLLNSNGERLFNENVLPRL